MAPYDNLKKTEGAACCLSVIFTSFHRSNRYSGEKFAICERQPEEFNYPELSFFNPVGADGKPIRSADYFRRPRRGFNPHDFYDLIAMYREAVLAGYCQHNLPEIKNWLMAITPKDDLVLCCWCPHSKAARSQINDLGVMACHSGIVAEVIDMCRPDLTIIMDVDRSNHMVPQWQVGIQEQPCHFSDVEALGGELLGLAL